MVGFSYINNQFGFVLEYAENGSLRDCENISIGKCMKEICSAMSLLHSFGIIHRDLKPGNILVDSNCDIKLSDFGISRSYDEDMTKDAGTPGFIAPEVKGGSYDYRADVYSAGVVACFLIDRKRYIDIVSTLREGNHYPSIPYSTEVILRVMLSENSEDRPTFLEIYKLIKGDQYLVNIDEIDCSFSFPTIYEAGNDYIHYKKSKSNIGLFHCLMFHFINSNKEKAGELSHLGKLIGDEFMSYLFDWLVEYEELIAKDIELFYNKEYLFERFLSMDTDDYRFWLMPPPKVMNPKTKHNNDYNCFKGIELKKTDQEKALHYFKKSFKSGNIEAGYQIGRIYSLMNDSRCIRYLNHLSLSGHKKSSYYLALFFGRLKYKRHSKLMNYFFRISNDFFKYLGIKNNYKLEYEFIEYNKKEFYLFFTILYRHSKLLHKLWKIGFKYYRIFNFFDSYLMGLFYLNVLGDKVLANKYLKCNERIPSLLLRYEIVDEEERRKIDHKLEQKAKEGYKMAKIHLIFAGLLDNEPIEKSKFLKDLMISDFCISPEIQLLRGLEYFSKLDFLNGKIYIDFAAKQNYLLAVFIQSLLKFHGHGYQKERVKSLERLITLGKEFGDNLPCEVGILLLQGIHIRQDIDRGIELIKIAESSGIEIPKAIHDGHYYIKYPSIFSIVFTQKEFLTFYKGRKMNIMKSIEAREPIIKNPIFQTEAGRRYFYMEDYQNAEYWFRLAIEQDYYEAEFYYALLCKSEESINHLLRASKAGYEEAQVLLGMSYIYGINQAVNIEEGIKWLENASYQEDPMSWKVLASIYFFGAPNIPQDRTKYFEATKEYKRLTNNLDFDDISQKIGLLITYIKKYSKELADYIISKQHEYYNIAIKCFAHFDYEKGIQHIDNAADIICYQAVFLQSFWKFHGHFYQKEREKSLERLIFLGKKVGGDLAYEVGILLLQGIHIRQDIDRGIELIKIAESSGIEIPKAIHEGHYNILFPTIYHSLIKLDFLNNKTYNADLLKEIEAKEPIVKNPEIQKMAGCFFLKGNDIKSAEYWFRLSSEQDFNESDFFLSLICEEKESIDHLYKAAKGGIEQAQVLLGLYLIYGIKHEVNKEEGIYWLESAAYQEYPIALVILSSIYSNGYQNIPSDLNKANIYAHQLETYIQRGKIGIDPYFYNEIKKVIMKSGDQILPLSEVK